jgi:hypothetical protein
MRGPLQHNTAGYQSVRIKLEPSVWTLIQERSSSARLALNVTPASPHQIVLLRRSALNSKKVALRTPTQLVYD